MRRRRVRRDEGIPPYVSPDSRGRPGWPKTQNLFVGSGFIPPGEPRAAAVRADMESAPTRVCNAAGLWFPVWPYAVPPVVGADSISARGCPRRRRVRRDEGIPSYVCPDSRGRPGWPKTQNLFVGAGFIPPAGAFRRPTAAQRRLLGRRSRPRDLAPPRGSRDDASIVPYRGCNNAGPRPSRLAQNIKFIRRGGIYPARGRSRRREVPGTMQASSPTEVAITRGRGHPIWSGVCRGL